AHSHYLHLLFTCAVAHGNLHSFPTRRSSDLEAWSKVAPPWVACAAATLARSTRARSWPRRSNRSPRTRPTASSRRSSTTRSLARSEEHTSELQSPDHLVCRLLLEKKQNKLHI